MNRSATLLRKTNESIVAIFHSHAEADAAIKELQRANFDLKKLSMVGRDFQTQEHVVGYYNAGDRMQYWGSNKIFWGGIAGLLVGSAIFIIPGIGPLVMAGPLVTTIAGNMEGAVVLGGLSVLGAGFHSIGIPKDSILQYETALKANKFLLIAHGEGYELGFARDIINRIAPEALADPCHSEAYSNLYNAINRWQA